MRKIVSTVVSVALLTFILSGCDEPPRSQPTRSTPSPTPAPTPNVVAALEANRVPDALRYLADAKQTAEGLTDEYMKFDALSEVALAFAKAGQVDEAKRIVASIQPERERSKLLLYKRSTLLAKIYVIQTKAGEANGAAATLEQAKSTVADYTDRSFKCDALVGIVDAQARTGDYTGALATLTLLECSFSKAQALRVIAVAQARTGDIGMAKSTASIIEDGWTRVKALSSIIAAQAKSGDLSAARLTFDQARTITSNISDTYNQKDARLSVAFAQALAGDVPGATASAGAIRAVDCPRLYRVIAVAQARAGDFNSALASVELTSGDDDYKVVAGCAVAVMQAKAGDMAGARRTLEKARSTANSVTSTESKGIDMAAITDADARINGYATAEHSADTIFDPYPRARALTALANARLDPEGNGSFYDEGLD